MGRPARLKVEILGDAKGLKSEVESADGVLGKLGDGAKKAGAAAAVGLGVAAAAAVGLASDAVRAASELQQSTGAIESVFGKTAATVKSWAQNSAKDVGLATSAYQNLAVVTGAQLKNMGLSTEEAAGQTQKLIGLGADLAATYGGDVSSAVQAVGSLLRGESDPIEAYGVSINQAKIQAELAAQGLDKLTGAAATQAKAQVTLGLLFKQTKDAAGAFGRETDTLANRQQVASAMVENLKAKLGTALLPVLTQVGTYLIDKGIPALEGLAEEARERLGPALAAVGIFAATKLLPGIEKVQGFLTETMVPAWRSTVIPIINGVKSAFGSVSKAVSDNSTDLSALGKALTDVVTFGQRYVAPVIGTLLGGAFRTLGTVLGVVVGAIMRALGALNSMVEAAQRALQALRQLRDALAAGLPNLSLPDLNPFNDASVHVLSPSLATGAPDVTRWAHELTTSAAAGTTWSTSSPGRTSTSSAPVMVDRRTIRITVNGAIDPVGTARTIRELLRADEVRLGHASTIGMA